MNERFINRVNRNDRWARRLIYVFGIGVIVMVFLILAIIIISAMPLFAPTQLEKLSDSKVESEQVLAAGMDEYQEIGFVIDDQGHFHFQHFDSAATTNRAPKALDPGISSNALRQVSAVGFNQFCMLWDDGAAAQIEVQFHPIFNEEGKRVDSSFKLKTVSNWKPDTAATNLAKTLVGKELRADLDTAGKIHLLKISEEEDFLGNITRTEDRGLVSTNVPFTHLMLSQDGQSLVTAAGKSLFRWDIRSFKRPVAKRAEHAEEITALGFVNGDVSIAVGDQAGGLTTYMLIESALSDAERRKLSDKGISAPRELARIHTLRSHAESVSQIVTARRNKTILSASSAGIVHADYMTSERPLGGDLDCGGPIRGLAFAARGDGLLACRADGSMMRWHLDQPHPEVSMKTLFGKVHYENFSQPEYIWQSSSGDDTHEPKLSLIPLIIGTLKATVYAMLFAIPIAILGALYTSQFMHPTIRNTIKPSVEIMAAVPSVVIGFLAAYWLAPILARHIPTLFMSLVVLPTVLIILVLWMRSKRPGMGRGHEFFWLVPVLIIGVALAVGVGRLIESQMMVVPYYPRGDFGQWLSFTFEGMSLDPRNAILISFALGFAVMPIIFTLADDALSGVPRGLSAASLALGASRWQTAWKVVLPSASPGIFAAVMIGFGRAIGETMIVLMAAGGTAVLNFNPFSGMRTLSANLATEMPEAAHYSTHWRVLFLSAVLLFLMTFVVNTMAEMIRLRLRKKYGNY